MNPANTEGRKPVAAVTGAARGIGRAITLELLRHGYQVAAIDIEWSNAEGFEDTGTGSWMLKLRADTSDLDGHAPLLDIIVDKLGGLDLLVNNAGVAPLVRHDILDLTPESYDRVMNINLRGPLFFSRHVARRMLAARAADPDRRMAIVFITSVSAATSSTRRGEYCISKSGLSMAATLYADRLAAEGIGVFEIRPGIILTPMTEPVKEKYDRLIAEGLIPQMRWGQPQDVAKAVAAIADGAFDYSTGAVIEISGGMNIRRL